MPFFNLYRHVVCLLCGMDAGCLCLCHLVGQVKPWCGVCIGWCCAPWLVTDGTQCWHGGKPVGRQDATFGEHLQQPKHVFSQSSVKKCLTYFCLLSQWTVLQWWGKGGGWSGQKNFSRLSAQLSPRFHVWHNRLGLTGRKFEQGRKVLGTIFILKNLWCLWAPSCHVLIWN